eukprot:630473-Hanusia_phi.AAC.1
MGPGGPVAGRLIGPGPRGAAAGRAPVDSDCTTVPGLISSPSGRRPRRPITVRSAAPGAVRLLDPGKICRH